MSKYPLIRFSISEFLGAPKIQFYPLDAEFPLSTHLQRKRASPSQNLTASRRHAVSSGKFLIVMPCGGRTLSTRINKVHMVLSPEKYDEQQRDQHDQPKVVEVHILPRDLTHTTRTTRACTPIQPMMR
jgi:hypothetical protein